MKKLYAFLAVIVFTLTGLLNLSNKLIVCSLIYVSMASIANIMAHWYKKKATLALIIGCLVVYTLLCWGMRYTIHKIPIHLMVPGSLAAVLLSVSVGITLFSKLKARYNFHMSNFISLLVASTIDSGIVVGIVLYGRFSTSKLMAIFFRDLIFKSGYAMLMGLFVFSITSFYRWFFLKKLGCKPLFKGKEATDVTKASDRVAPSPPNSLGLDFKSFLQSNSFCMVLQKSQVILLYLVSG
ncbi:MAG: hypothetical protein K2X94_04545 [Amoebophilaceae bacterium]|nr:hypothetical protein [Amoebophilaceae bacterium]